jgi:hypothetical protein
VDLGARRWDADFEPTADALMEGAYYRYVDQGSQPGQDVRHWLDSEAELLKERPLSLRQDRTDGGMGAVDIY